MIKKLQHKFILITMASLLLVVVILIGSINLANLYQTEQRANAILRLLSENDGSFDKGVGKTAPPNTSNFASDSMDSPTGDGTSSVTKDNPEAPPSDPADKATDTNATPDNDSAMPGLFSGQFQMTPETEFQTRYFFVRFDPDGAVLETNMNHIAAITTEEAEAYALDVLSSDKTSGRTGYYKYAVTEADSGSLVIFVDFNEQFQTLLSFLVSSTIVALFSLLMVFILVTFLSRRAIRPFVESMEKQKQFITNAGHEIKTPLAIISANTDVIELSTGQSEWVDSIRHQVTRLSNLVASLLSLSKLEEAETQPLSFTQFPISEVTLDEAAPFETLAASQGKHFTTDIQQGLTLLGNEKSIRQLISILLDNAVKYAADNGQICISLHQSGKQLKLEVCNTGTPPEGDLNRLFERFYRADDSRARATGGYGIGLSIAKAVVEAHKGHISAHGEGTSIRFTVTL